ncbi:MAG: methylmalonic aciduria and homocystinuria type D protein [Cyanobacteria bacterium J06600_6]
MRSSDTDKIPSPIELKILDLSSSKNIDVCVASPHKFLVENQSQLLPDWDNRVNSLILVLQQSSISFQASIPQVAREKNLLRAKFIRFACNLMFALQDRGYASDLFDPRTGYPLFASPGTAFDDNAAVKAVLNYPVVNYEQCSLITHPRWEHHVYPGTIATVAEWQQIKPCMQEAIANQNWSPKC